MIGLCLGLALLAGPSLAQAAQDSNGDSEESGDAPRTTETSCPDGEICFWEPFPGGEESITIEENDGAVSIMSKYVGMLFLFGTGFVAVLAVIWIIIGGYEIMFSGASGGEISEGKQKITKALFGLVLLFLAAALLHFINPGFYQFG